VGCEMIGVRFDVSRSNLGKGFTSSLYMCVTIILFMCANPMYYVSHMWAKNQKNRTKTDRGKLGVRVVEAESVCGSYQSANVQQCRHSGQNEWRVFAIVLFCLSFGVGRQPNLNKTLCHSN